MQIQIWIAVSGLIFTIGGLIWGFGWGAGSSKKELEEISLAINKFSAQLEDIKGSFQSYQLTATQAATEAKIALGMVRSAVEALQMDVRTNLATLVTHAGDRSLHTDNEWREGILTQLREIAADIKADQERHMRNN